MIFKKLKINNTTLKNRIVISPMCQYSSKNGCPSDWHYNHLNNLSSTGASMVILESTAIDKIGRISRSDLCLYNNTHEKKLGKLVKYLKKNNNNVKYGIQISHSGRKGSSYEPLIRYNTPLKKRESWQTIAPSAIKRAKHWPEPHEMSKKKIKELIQKFKSTLIRAKRIGFDCLEIHMAHGYLLHQFFSPISNKRTDEYGGSFENRSRLLIEISTELRKLWPRDKILGARITGSDHLKKGISLNESCLLAKKLKEIGLDYISVSSGGIIPITKMKQSEVFRLKMANKIKEYSKITTTMTGMITNQKIAKEIINKNKIDFITIARIIIRNPRWIFQFAKQNKADDIIPKQYRRLI